MKRKRISYVPSESDILLPLNQPPVQIERTLAYVYTESDPSVSKFRNEEVIRLARDELGIGHVTVGSEALQHSCVVLRYIRTPLVVLWMLESWLDENFVTLQGVIASDKDIATELQHEEESA